MWFLWNVVLTQIMAEDLVAWWRELTFIEKEKDCVVIEGVHDTNDALQEKKWIMDKVMTSRSFNKEAMMSMLRIVWRLSMEVGLKVMDESLFLFKPWRISKRFWVVPYGHLIGILLLSMIMMETWGLQIMFLIKLVSG